MSFDFQEAGEPYASSVMDDFYRGRPSGGFFGVDSFSDASSSSHSRTSPRRATSPMSFSSFGPRSPLATMFAFDPLDDLPEVISRDGGYFDETKEEDDDENNSGARATFGSGSSSSEIPQPPVLMQTLSPPVATGRYIPPFLRNRGSATAAPSPPAPLEDYGGSPTVEPMPAPAPGRWVPPSQREGFAPRLSIDSHAMTMRESFSDNFFFEETDSYSIGDDVHGVTSLIGVRKAMEDVCCCIPDLNAHFGDDFEYHQKQSIYVLFDGHSGVRVRDSSRPVMLRWTFDL